ncbi:MAG: Spy/CpxP family protein refolding chaperone [Planctomycetota bacterium]
MTSHLTCEAGRNGPRKKHLGLGVALILFLAVAAGVAYAFGHGRRSESPSELIDRVNRGVKHVLRRVDASEAQEREIRAIADGLTPDLVRYRVEQRALVQRLTDALRRESVDPKEIDAIHADAVTLADQTVRRVLDAATEISKKLTPEQRRKLGDAGRRRR